ncbi:sulfite exporter TauE/SafE family protein [Amycolatopsis sp., V23-08]|uniref:Probable membrane transporter protein n=1 Tax=Amycolatopsis heterodermiae TaxID=3110235 RepID=A0ABU5R9E5_9PSEU|nr:sulfite exporter TauE/SafE family protein [Amycolatopsis sp., V23-08]MEA5362846.1 sulfite exporter TauE/SafE family protein [Amycolatopsis sp., V23-08]
MLLFGLGVLSGVTTALFGFGGGFVTVPVVYAVAAAGPGAMHVAVGTSAAVMLVNSLGATVTVARAGRLHREYVWPLAAFVAAGASLGALAATSVPDGVLHALFAAYLAATILDSLLRRGFVHGSERRPLSRATVTAGGLGIGAVAAFLGVGGSVLTVPLLRRRGLPMSDATALANPLSLPVAAVATAVYLTAPGPAAIDPAAAGLLLAGSLPTIALLRRWSPAIPDRAHAVAYLGLLGAALVTVLA